jgi:hypothetical protein
MRSQHFIAAVLCLCASQAIGGALTEARVTKTINDVAVVDPAKRARPANIGDVIKDEVALKTGVKSRSELLFQDNTLTRIGPETFFTFKTGTREMSLPQGTMLLQVPKGLGGATIHTAAVTASITGTTIMIEHTPGKNLKVLVLEGSLRLSVNGTFGDSLLLQPGRMVIMRPDAKRIPDPVAVDISRVMKTSSLVNMGSKNGGSSLPSASLIDHEIQNQAQAKSGNTLVDTNLVIVGHGTNVMLGSDNLLAQLDQRLTSNTATRDASPTPAPSTTPVATPVPSATPIATATPQPSSTPQTSPTPPPTSTPQSTATPAPSATPHSTATPVPSATPQPSSTPEPTSTPGPTATPQPTSTPETTATPAPSASPTATAAPSATASPTVTPNDGDDRVVNYGTPDAPLDSDVTLDKPIDLTQGHGSGAVNVNTSGSVAISSSIKVSDADENKNASKHGGKIAVNSSKPTGTAIAVSSSAQLLSLLSNTAAGPGGSIKFVSAGGDVNVTGATMKADRGTIDLRNNGATGVVNLNSATLHGDIVKIGALGDHGQLNIGGGTIDADSVIKLFAGGSNGTVNFTDSVTLSGNSAKTISGDTVTIFSGKTVTVLGPAPANVFTNHPNYTGFGGNNTTTGTFGGQGATTQLPPPPGF